MLISAGWKCFHVSCASSIALRICIGILIDGTDVVSGYGITRSPFLCSTSLYLYHWKPMDYQDKLETQDLFQRMKPAMRAST